MKIYSYIIILFLLVDSVYAQESTKLEIINSNFSYFDADVNPNARRLVDSVIFKHEGATMFCDSAWHYFKENRFEAFGNIHINQGDTLHLYGDHLDYIGKENKAIIQGNIVLKDEQVHLTTEQLHYDLSSKIASYYTGAKILSGENKLYSIKGNYYSESKMLLFKKDVLLENPKYTTESDTLKYHTINEVAYFFGPTKINSDNNFIYCEKGWYNTQSDISQFSKNAYLWSGDQRLSGDSLYYDRNRGYGLAIRNITVLDTLNDYIVSGHWAEYFEKEDSFNITENTMLTLIMDSDSLFMHGDTINGTLDKSGKRFLKVYNQVQFFSKDLSGMCMYLTYSVSDSTIRLFEEPVLWSSDYQLSGNHISLQMLNNQIHSLLLENNAFIISEGSPNLFNQIKGREMLGYFKNNELSKIVVLGNGETVYVLKDEFELITGVNTVSCSEMRIDVKEKNIERISFQKEPDATLYPYQELPEKWKLLKGFSWRKSEKPLTKEDIFLR